MTNHYKGRLDSKVNKWRRSKIISTGRKVGNTWLVSHLKDSKKKGYFKYPTSFSKRYSGPIAANEYISYKLGKELKLPVAKTELAKVKGQAGIVSIKMKKNPLYNWNSLSKRHKNVFNHVIDPQRLIKMFVFDVWIVNIDRNNRNIVLYPTNKKNAYDFYLIDHGLSLYGSFIWKNTKWSSSYWDDIAKYNNRYLKGLRRYLRKNKNKIQKYIREIQALSNNKVKKFLNEVPAYLLTSAQKNVLYKFLVRRKKRLNTIVKRFIS
jgi:hypothetical protein